MPVPIELRDFHALVMTKRNTYKGSSAKIPEIVMSRSLAKKTFIYFPSISLLKNNPNQSANENVLQAAPGVGWGFLLTGGDAIVRSVRKSTSHLTAKSAKPRNDG